MTIHIEALTFEAIIGMLDFEREHTQTVVVTCTIEYDYTPETFINYALVSQAIERIMKEERFELLEVALTHLEKELKKFYPQMQSLYLKITKPDILPNATVGLSSSWKY